MTLFVLTEWEKRLLELSEEPEIEIPKDATDEEKEALTKQIEEQRQAYKDTLEAVHMDYTDKANGYGKVIRQLLADAEACKAEKLRLAAMQARYEKKAEQLKDALLRSMTELNLKKLKTELFQYSTRAGQELVIDAGSIWEIPDDYLRYKDPEPDKAAIKKFLKDNKADWAHLEDKQSLIIK